MGSTRKASRTRPENPLSRGIRLRQGRGVTSKPFLIFDLDGTLVDSLPGIAGSLNRSLRNHGLKGHSAEAVRSFVGDGLATLVRRAAPKGTDPEWIESIIRAFKSDYAATWREGTKPYEGIPELLESLHQRGFRMAVLSNKTDGFTVEMVSALFASIPFERVLGLRDGMPPKPDPTGALEIASAAEVAAKDCLVIGDSTMDVETARNAGMTAVAVAWGYHDRDRLIAAGATTIIESPADLFA